MLQSSSLHRHKDRHFKTKIHQVQKFEWPLLLNVDKGKKVHNEQFGNYMLIKELSF